MSLIKNDLMIAIADDGKKKHNSIEAIYKKNYGLLESHGNIYFYADGKDRTEAAERLIENLEKFLSEIHNDINILKNESLIKEEQNHESN